MLYPPKYWDADADFWDEVIADPNNPHQFYYSEADLYIHDLIRGANQVLELGCGTGGATLKIAQQCLDLVAFDYANKMVAVAAAKLNEARVRRRVSLLLAEGTHFPFADKSIDVVFCRGAILSYLRDPVKCLEEVRRVLRPKGKVGLDVMHSSRKRCHILKWFMVDRSEDGYYHLIELSDDGRYQTRRQWRVDREWKPPAGLELRRKIVRPPEDIHHHLREGEKARSAYYKLEEIRRFFQQTGFKNVMVYPLGCFSHVLSLRETQPDLVEKARRNRDLLCQLQKSLPHIFRLDTAPHVFVTATKLR